MSQTERQGPQMCFYAEPRLKQAYKEVAARENATLQALLERAAIEFIEKKWKTPPHWWPATRTERESAEQMLALLRSQDKDSADFQRMLTVVMEIWQRHREWKARLAPGK